MVEVSNLSTVVSFAAALYFAYALLDYPMRPLKAFKRHLELFKLHWDRLDDQSQQVFREDLFAFAFQIWEHEHALVRPIRNAERACLIVGAILFLLTIWLSINPTKQWPMALALTTAVGSVVPLLIIVVWTHREAVQHGQTRVSNAQQRAADKFEQLFARKEIAPSSPRSTEAQILSRLEVPLTLEGAQSIIKIKLSKNDTQRMGELLDKRDEGAVTPEEQQEAESFERIENLLQTLHSMAQRTLGEPKSEPS